MAGCKGRRNILRHADLHLGTNAPPIPPRPVARLKIASQRGKREHLNESRSVENQRGSSPGRNNARQLKPCRNQKGLLPFLISIAAVFASPIPASAQNSWTPNVFGGRTFSNGVVSTPNVFGDHHNGRNRDGRHGRVFRDPGISAIVDISRSPSGGE
jgi:hypothetical protein